MIIPTADFDPLFAEDGVSFRKKMLAYLQREFEDLLQGPARHLLPEIEQLADQTSAVEPIPQTAISADRRVA